jgi:hypothetical protein
MPIDDSGHLSHLLLSVCSIQVSFAPGVVVHNFPGAGVPIRNTTLRDEAVALAQAADITIVAVGDTGCDGVNFGKCTCGEGADRFSLNPAGGTVTRSLACAALTLGLCCPLCE